MSRISDIHDEIRSLLSTLFPDKRELSDSSDIDNNDEYQLKDGWGMQISSGLNTNRLVGCKFSISRVINITLTQDVKGGHKNIDELVTTEKAILEDHRTVIENFSKNENLGTLVTKRDWVNDSGIEKIFGEQKNFLKMELGFSIEYIEDFT